MNGAAQLDITEGGSPAAISSPAMLPMARALAENLGAVYCRPRPFMVEIAASDTHRAPDRVSSRRLRLRLCAKR
jgi:hypothetical protein